MKRFKKLLVFLTYFSLGFVHDLSLSPISHAWWDQGHETVAQIAEIRLTAQTQKKVIQLLRVSIESPGSPELSRRTQQISTSAVWADYLKQSLFKKTADTDPYGPNCHFINVLIPDNQLESYKNDKSKAYEAIQTQSTQGKNSISCTKKAIQTLSTLKDKPPKKEHAVALRYLIHLIGDIHQPLHNLSVSTHQAPVVSNLGGNKLKIPEVSIPVFHENKATTTTSVSNLHALWDAGLGAYLQFPYIEIGQKSDLIKISTPSEMKYGQAVRKDLLNRINKLETIKTAQQSVTLENWSAEAMQIGLELVYQGLDQNDENFPLHSKIQNPEHYFKEGKSAVRTQLALGGIRLGFLLNAIFDPKNAQGAYVKLVKEMSESQQLGD